MWVGPFLKFLIILRLWRRYSIKLKEVAIKGHNTRVGLVGAVIFYSLEIVGLKIGTLRVNSISIGVNLADPFRLHFRLSLKDSLGLVIFLSRVFVI